MGKCSLETQTRFIWAILGRKNSPLKEDFNVYYEKLKVLCQALQCEVYAYIGHDKDTEEDGEKKFRHIHLLMVLEEGTKPRLKTTLNRIANTTDIDPRDIDVELADNVEECIRYCVHKGYATKYQYPKEDLQTSLDNEELEAILNKTNETITASYLITACKVNGMSYVGVMKALGLKSYMKYRNAIRDIIEELKTDKK